MGASLALLLDIFLLVNNESSYTNRWNSLQQNVLGVISKIEQKNMACQNLRVELCWPGWQLQQHSTALEFGFDFYRDTEELIAYQEGRYGSYEYGRYGNPTTRTLEEKLRVLEGADDCLVSSSGMNSATTMLLALVPAGGHIVTTTDCYRRTRQFIQTVRRPFLSKRIWKNKQFTECWCKSMTTQFLLLLFQGSLPSLWEMQRCLTTCTSLVINLVIRKLFRLGYQKCGTPC